MSQQGDIAKRFDLPERRSKIATMLKEEELYCICRSSDSTRFMIACDACEEWYHGDCISVTEREANHIKRFYCRQCRDKDPQLKIRYKNKHSSSSKSSDPKEEKRNKDERKGNEEKKSKDKKKKKMGKDGERDAGKSGKDRGRVAPPSGGCGECRACLRSEECGKCGACRDMPAFGGAGGLKKPCRRRVCSDLKPSRSKPVAAGSSPRAAVPQSAVPPSPPLRRRSPSPPPPRRAAKSPSPSPSPPPRQKRRYSSEEDGDVSWQPTERPKRPTNASGRTTATAGGGKRQERRVRVACSSDDAEGGDGDSGPERDDGGPRQCCGPQCVKSSRPASRYCSDQCGLNLARNRIFQVLPQRIQEWNMTRCVSEERNTRTLEQIRRQQLEAQTQLERLNRLQSQLERLVERGRRLAVDPAALEDDADDEGVGLHCVTCGHEVPSRAAIRHMEKCFAKHESQTSFGSLYQTRVEGFNMFCDFYNRSTMTYCKRLRVLCPEHCKNPKIGDDESCGCPLLGRNFEPNGQVCRAPKKTCTRHLSWEKLRHAELDMERVRWAMKMDELMEQERQCRQSMANRAGVLALMLHSTYDHDIMEKVQNQQKKMAKKSRAHAH